VCVQTGEETLSVHVSGAYQEHVEGGSLGVAAALGLWSLLLRREGGPHLEQQAGIGSVAITGELDLVGRVHGVSGLAAKIRVRRQGRAGGLAGVWGCHPHG
jgi:predicted ATP-dependent protease